MKEVIFNLMELNKLSRDDFEMHYITGIWFNGKLVEYKFDTSLRRYKLLEIIGDYNILYHRLEAEHHYSTGRITGYLADCFDDSRRKAVIEAKIKALEE